MMRRFLPIKSSVVPPLLSSLLSQRNSYHYKSVDNEKDPFGEKASWDSHPSLGGWANVDVGSFVEAMETPEVQQKHFGPDWSRVRTLAREAVKRHGSFHQEEGNTEAEYTSEAAQSLARERVRREKLLQDKKDAEEQLEVQQQRKQENNNNNDDDDDSKPLSEKLSPQELQAAKIIMFSDAKLPSRGVEQEDVVARPTPKMEEIAGFRPPEALEVPKSIRLDNDEDENDEDDSDDDDDEETATADVARDALGFPVSDPLHWDTEDIILWIECYGPVPVDTDLMEAFRMSNVNGHTLLSKIDPPDLFKLMRKWHLKGRKDKFTRDKEDKNDCMVTTTVLQEQAIMCFPYGPP